MKLFAGNAMGRGLSVLLAGIAIAFVASAAEPVASHVTLHYVQRPPYMVESGPTLTGITGQTAYQAVIAEDITNQDFKQFQIKNMPPGEHRHIMCSKNVPDGVIGNYMLQLTFSATHPRLETQCN